ncbi:hypothetical protein HanIR_Chr16g0816861 [Helianthus annuus]|nr:hypothetical protein HanIR_Chr16g0816861 [Helianthus annuus]
MAVKKWGTSMASVKKKNNGMRNAAHTIFIDHKKYTKQTTLLFQNDKIPLRNCQGRPWRWAGRTTGQGL